MNKRSKATAVLVFLAALAYSGGALKIGLGHGDLGDILRGFFTGG